MTKKCMHKLSACPEFHDLSQIMTVYRMFHQFNISMEYIQESMNAVDLLNYYLHLIHAHSTAEEFEAIMSAIGNCDVTDCRIFKRHFANNIQFCDVTERVLFEIMDKIHCFYYHSVDIGHKLRLSSHSSNFNGTLQRKQPKYLHENHRDYSRYNQFKIAKKDEPMQNKDDHKSHERSHGLYDFGLLFDYGVDDNQWEYAFDRKRAIYVHQTHTTLKHELITNNIARLTLEQFNNEYQKAQVHFDSKDCRKKYRANKFTIQHLLALMVYCNYDNLQREFSKTYRENNGENHHHFFNLGKYLKLAVHRFGDRISNFHVKCFYHGIGEPLGLQQYVGNWLEGIHILCPLSTSSSFEVAMNFTNDSQGIIVEFGVYKHYKFKPHEHYNLVQCFPMYWLSDFTSEFEYFFIQNYCHFMGLEINNIIDPQNHIEIKDILDALKVINEVIHPTSTAKDILSKKVTPSTEMLVRAILNDRLSSHASSYPQFKTLTDDARYVIQTHFDRQHKITLNCIFSQIELKFLGIFFEPDDKWIKLSLIDLLYPNLTEIIIKNANISNIKTTFCNIVNLLAKKPNITVIRIETENKNVSYVFEQNYYDAQIIFAEIGYVFNGDYNVGVYRITKEKILSSLYLLTAIQGMFFYFIQFFEHELSFDSDGYIEIIKSAPYVWNGALITLSLFLITWCYYNDEELTRYFNIRLYVKRNACGVVIIWLMYQLWFIFGFERIYTFCNQMGNQFVMYYMIILFYMFTKFLPPEQQTIWKPLKEIWKSAIFYFSASSILQFVFNVFYIYPIIKNCIYSHVSVFGWDKVSILGILLYIVVNVLSVKETNALFKQYDIVSDDGFWFMLGLDHLTAFCYQMGNQYSMFTAIVFFQEFTYFFPTEQRLIWKSLRKITNKIVFYYWSTPGIIFIFNVFYIYPIIIHCVYRHISLFGWNKVGHVGILFCFVVILLSAKDNITVIKGFDVGVEDMLFCYVFFFYQELQLNTVPADSDMFLFLFK
eukprot:452897_1